MSKLARALNRKGTKSNPLKGLKEYKRVIAYRVLTAVVLKRIFNPTSKYPLHFLTKTPTQQAEGEYNWVIKDYNNETKKNN